MAKYRIFSLESFEFVIERNVTFDQRWNIDDSPSLITYRLDFIYLNQFMPENLISIGSAQIKVFLTLKKAQKWIAERCEQYQDYGVTPDQFRIESINIAL